LAYSSVDCFLVEEQIRVFLKAYQNQL